MQNTILNKKWRLHYLYKIVGKDAKVTTFKPNYAQQQIRDIKIRQIKEKGRVRLIILKARQLGMTTFELIDGLDDALFKMNQTIIITAHKQDKQLEMFQRVKFAYEQMPDEIEDPEVPGGVRKKPKPKYDSKTEYYFPDTNSYIRVALDSRSGTPTRLHLTELAFREDAEAMMTGTLPSVPKNAPVTIETTANGAGGYFYDMWNKYYDNPKGEYDCIFLPRYTDSEYILEEEKDIPDELMFLQDFVRPDTQEKLTKDQINWYVNEREKLGQKVFQEMPTTAEEAFLLSGDNVFNINILRKTPEVPFTQDKLYDHLRWYNDKKTDYAIIGVDTAEGGEHGDFSSIVVRDYKTLDLIAAFYDKYPPDALCDVLDYIWHIVKNGIIGIERNNTGLTTLNTAIDKNRNYTWKKNLFRMPTIDEISKKKSSKLGWITNTRTRPYMIGDYEKAVRLGEITQFDKRGKSEMYSFVYNEKKKAEAMQGCHDDMIMADAICYQMRNEPMVTNEKKKTRVGKRKILDPVTMEYKYV